MSLSQTSLILSIPERYIHRSVSQSFPINLNPLIYFIKVEAKRAVPRSEIAKELSAASNTRQYLLAGAHAPYSANLKSPGYTSPPPQIPQNKSSASLASYSSASSSGSYNPMYDSRGASDPRINMEEYAYNKVFVGGLHYDTRDGDIAQ